MRGETNRGCTSAPLGSRLVRHLSLGAPLPCSSARKMPHAQDRAPPVNGDTLDTPCALNGRQGRDQTREERSKFGLRPTRCTPLRQRKLVDALRTFGSFSHNHAIFYISGCRSVLTPKPCSSPNGELAFATRFARSLITSFGDRPVSRAKLDICRARRDLSGVGSTVSIRGRRDPSRLGQRAKSVLDRQPDTCPARGP